MKRTGLLLVFLAMIVGCQSDDGVVTVKDPGENKPQQGEPLWERACDYVVARMRNEFTGDEGQEEIDEMLKGIHPECMKEIEQYSDDESDLMALCLLEADKFKEFAKCEPESGGDGDRK